MVIFSTSEISPLYLRFPYLHTVLLVSPVVVCHRYGICWWLVKLESWCWHCVTVIRVEQVMLYLCLVMDHIFVLCSNSLSESEEPPCSVTLIR